VKSTSPYPPQHCDMGRLHAAQREIRKELPLYTKRPSKQETSTHFRSIPKGAEIGAFGGPWSSTHEPPDSDPSTRPFWHGLAFALGILGEFDDYFLHILRGPKNGKGKQLAALIEARRRLCRNDGFNSNGFIGSAHRGSIIGSPVCCLGTPGSVGRASRTGWAKLRKEIIDLIAPETHQDSGVSRP